MRANALLMQDRLRGGRTLRDRPSTKTGHVPNRHRTRTAKQICPAATIDTSPRRLQFPTIEHLWYRYSILLRDITSSIGKMICLPGFSPAYTIRLDLAGHPMQEGAGHGLPSVR